MVGKVKWMGMRVKVGEGKKRKKIKEGGKVGKREM